MGDCGTLLARTMPSPSPSVLLVEDDDGFRTAVEESLTDQGYTVDAVASGEQARERLEVFAYDAVVTDLRLQPDGQGGLTGEDVLDYARARYPDIAVIVMTGYADVRSAVALIRRGAADFVEKPLPALDVLHHALDVALEQRRLRSENARLREALDGRDMGGVIGRSRPMQQLFEIIDTIAPTTSTVLITGETGTGKEVVARAIHQRSARRAQPFVALNCAAIPETLLEAELFGHVRGAFTGAVAQRQGRFEQAHRGTLFLDEVGTMSAALQAKLLRALQEREFERVGESRTTRVDVRVIGATHSDLQQMVRDGLFREDLFYRLNVIPLQLPPLRERREDIPLLVQHFLQRGGAETSPPLAIAQEAMRALMDYSWPGNVRQLENAIERAVAFGRARGRIERSDLPPDVAAVPQQAGTFSILLPDDGLDLEATVDAIARDLIVRALERTGGHKGQAATLLGLKRTTLVEKLKRLQLPETS